VIGKLAPGCVRVDQCFPAAREVRCENAVQCTLYKKSPKSQSCEIVANVLQFMHKYVEENKFVIPVSDVNERVASETRVFKIFLKIIRKEGNSKLGG
jgi:hypothetical protein